MTSTPTRPVDNVVITTKGLQDRNIHIIDGTTVEDKDELILLNNQQRIVLIPKFTLNLLHNEFFFPILYKGYAQGIQKKYI